MQRGDAHPRDGGVDFPLFVFDLEQESRELARTTWTMSVSSEVQRTLVKSPPELWAELSDPTALARHLGELGEIRITRVEPEKTVEWEAADATGMVRLKPSGWGTKVTLTGPLRLRYDYRLFNLRGDPLYSKVHRFYAGVNLAF